MRPSTQGSMRLPVLPQIKHPLASATPGPEQLQIGGGGHALPAEDRPESRSNLFSRAHSIRGMEWVGLGWSSSSVQTVCMDDCVFRGAAARVVLLLEKLNIGMVCHVPECKAASIWHCQHGTARRGLLWSHYYSGDALTRSRVFIIISIISNLTGCF